MIKQILFSKYVETCTVVMATNTNG